MCLQVLRNACLLLACFCKIQSELYFNPFISWRTAQTDNGRQKGRRIYKVYIFGVHLVPGSVCVHLLTGLCYNAVLR